MNSLSWMIYFAGVAGSVSGVLTGIAVISLLFGVGTAIASAVYSFSSPTIWSWDDKAEKMASWKRGADATKGLWKKAALIGIVSALLASIIPSSNTVYAIAASQAGEKIAVSETGQKAVKALNAWLDRQMVASPKERDGDKSDN